MNYKRRSSQDSATDRIVVVDEHLHTSTGLLHTPHMHVIFVLSRDYNCDSTAIRLRHDYDEKLTCSFFAGVESRRMEAGACDTS